MRGKFSCIQNPRTFRPGSLNREVLQYAEDCVVVAPQSVRDRLKHKVRNICHLYEIETRD